MKITRASPHTRKTNVREIPVTTSQLVNWEQGMLIQEAMPNLSADDREFIMTGLTPEDWDELFGEEK
jgi:hypothetical protein